MILNFPKKTQKNVDIRYSKTLPSELIRPIVHCLKNDKKSLHSCLLVSRDWCRETVNLLWRQPFHFLYNCNEIISDSSQCNNPKSKNQCFCSKEKRQYQATNLLITYLSIKQDKEFVEKGIIKVEDERIITFDYFEFLCILDLHELNCAVKDWNQWNKSNSNGNKDNYSSPTFKSIMRYFFTNIPKLETLSLDTKFIFYEINNTNPCSFLIKVDKNDDNDDDGDNYVSRYDNCILKLLVKESKVPETIQFFANLTELVFTVRKRKYEILSSLTLICHNIQKLIISIGYPINAYCGNAVMAAISGETNSLASLIRSQHNLFHFELFDIPAMGINVILKSLKESQCNSLKTLILNNARISNNCNILFYLKYLQNLQELRFNRCICSRTIILSNEYNKIDIFDEEKKYEEGLWLPNLKYLQVDYIDEKRVEFKELSSILSSILIRCSPLISK
jgi:hypothetical protein